jgi:hypothetical protein
MSSRLRSASRAALLFSLSLAGPFAPDAAVSRGNKGVPHESVLLINMVTLPRSMEMARFYVGQ